MRLTGILVTVALGLSSSIASAGDWPQWGYGPSRNMASDAKNLPLSFGPGKPKDGSRQIDMSTTRNVKWALVLGSQTYGNPVISSGKILNKILLLEKMSNTPITANGILYVTTGRYLYAVKGQ